MIDQIYNDAEKFNTVQSEVITLLEKNKPLLIMVKAAGYYEKVVSLLPRIILLLLSSQEGLQILNEIGLEDKVKHLANPD